MTDKATEEELNDCVIETLILSTLLSERFEMMNENNLFVQKPKQALKNLIPHIENYVKKLTEIKDVEDTNHFNNCTTVILELKQRVEKTLKTENITDISTRKRYLKECIEETVLFPKQKQELYESIRDSGILNY